MSNLPFKFEIPIDAFFKAGPKGKERRIGGIISTESEDRQGEIVLQRGLDFSDFVKNGWFNDNHSKDIAGVLGYPDRVEPTVHKGKPAHYVEGYLLETSKANEIWELAQSLQKTGRRLGFSIEGQVVKRDGLNGEKIAQAKVRNVAITHCPVNTDTGLDILAKSMKAIESEYTSTKALPIPPPTLKSKDKDKDEDTDKALTAGQSVSNPGTKPGEGFALRTESLERKKKKALTKSEAIQFIMSRYVGMTKAKAERVLSFHAARQPQTRRN